MNNANFYTEKFVSMNAPKDTKEQLGSILPIKVENPISNEVAFANQEVSQSVAQTLDSIEQTESTIEKLKRYQILHIDDEDLILKLVPRVFSKKVLKVQSFKKSKDLLNALEMADIPTIVISDNNFEPGITGLDLAERTYEFRQAKNIPFIIFCSDSKEEVQTRIKKLLEERVLDGYIEKPSLPNDMTTTVLNAIK